MKHIAKKIPLILIFTLMMTELIITKEINYSIFILVGYAFYKVFF